MSPGNPSWWISGAKHLGIKKKQTSDKLHLRNDLNIWSLEAARFSKSLKKVILWKKKKIPDRISLWPHLSHYETKLASTSQSSTWLCLLSAGNKGVCLSTSDRTVRNKWAHIIKESFKDRRGRSFLYLDFFLPSTIWRFGSHSYPQSCEAYWAWNQAALWALIQ